MIGVIIHEVGHNFFPMIVNSDERQWTWMDEGLNSFVEYLTEELWDNKYPSKKGAAYTIVDYMKLPKNELRADHDQLGKHSKVWAECLYQTGNSTEYSARNP